MVDFDLSLDIKIEEQEIEFPLISEGDREFMQRDFVNYCNSTMEEVLDFFTPVFCSYGIRRIPIVFSTDIPFGGGFNTNELKIMIKREPEFESQVYLLGKENWVKLLEDRANVLAHEVGHYMHYYVNPLVFVNRYSKELGPAKVKTVLEVIPNLVVFRNLDRKGKFEDLKIFPYIDCNIENNYANLALEFFKKNYWNIDEVLRRMARMKINDAYEMLVPYLCSLKKGFSIPGEIYFGTCVKEESDSSQVLKEKQLRLFD